MAERKPKEEPQERDRDDTDLEWEGFRDFVKKMGRIPKEDLNEMLAKRAVVRL